MLAVSPLSNCDGRDNKAADDSSSGFLGGEAPMLENIDIDIDFDFDDIFLRFDGAYVLPDLGDPDEIFADFSVDQYGEDEMGKEAKSLEVISSSNELPDLRLMPKTEKRRKVKGSEGKRKVKKVDWTPELHQRFVHAVEQLGLEKAVPSRILELMGNVGLTRHNIASHLQKYRSHRKHLLAREAEAASWRQRQHMYSSTGMAVTAKKDMSPWLGPTMAFPPLPPPFRPTNYRPFHVWGHPPLQQWPLPQHAMGPNALTHGMPYFPLPLPAMRFPSPSVPVSLKSKQLASPLQSFEIHPSKESIDAAIGDVIAKPWLPLPLGLKPPSLESVMKELQKKGISKIPPTA